MTLVMAYVVLIAAGSGACAVVLESAVRARGGPTRWLWVSALGATILATGFAVFVPRPEHVLPIFEAAVAVGAGATTEAAAAKTGDFAPADVLNASDLVLPVAWLLATALLLVALAVGQWRFRREQRAARLARLVDHDVLLTKNLGPAVAGVWRPVVFVPAWVLALDESSQRLLLAHELEHVKRRDTSLLLSGALTAAVLPWNPVVWWMVRRLRQAVEQDCDARVLCTYPGVRRYADLLLTAASRHGLGARLLAAHFGEEASDLMKRIEAMTSRNIHWSKLAVSALVATILVFAACEAPRPEPVAPIAPNPPAAAGQLSGVSERSVEFSRQRERCTPAGGRGCAMTVIVRTSEGKEIARYAGEIPVAHVPEASIHMIHVENGKCGADECSLIWITLKPDASLPRVPEGSIEARKMREAEIPIVVQGKVLLDASKAVLRSKSPDSEVVDMELRRALESAHALVRDFKSMDREQLERPRIVLRRDASPIEMPNILITSSTGAEVRRILAQKDGRHTPSSLAEIDQSDISAVEVLKGNACASSSPIPCPLVRITLKAGTEGKYKQR